MTIQPDLRSPGVLGRTPRALWQSLLFLMALLASMCLVACGGSGSGSSSTSTKVSVTISPVVTTVIPGGTVQLSATVSNSSNVAVQWTTVGGSVTQSGLFTAPSTIGVCYVTVTSVADPTVSATATITVASSTNVQVTLTPSKTSVNLGGTVQFTATVANASNTAVTWAASAGTISSTGLFTAPSTTQTVDVTATSVADPTVIAHATVSVLANGPVVTLDSHNSFIGTNETLQLTAHVSNTTNQAVTWTATGGTISSSGLYQAGHTPGTYSITATSVADSSASVTTPITIKQVTVSLAPQSPSVLLASTQQFTATVGGTLNTGVTWSATAGTISSSGLYTAPSSGTTATVTATSLVDPSVSASTTVTFVAKTDVTYDFSSGAPTVWSPTQTATSPSGEKFLGILGGTQSAILTLTNVTKHSTISLTFDLYVIGDWDGTAKNGLFTVTANSNSVFSKTFSNMTGDTQTYPDGGTNDPGTGRQTQNSLGYSISAATKYNDTTYHIALTITDTSSTLVLNFTSALTDVLANEGWGIDNVHVVANP